MKIKYCLFFVLAISSALMAANVTWTGPITFTPANPFVGDNVTIQASLIVKNGVVNNIDVTGKIDGKIVYSNLFPIVNNQQTITFPVNWIAAHSTKMMRKQGQPSKVKVEFSFSTTDAVGTTGYSTETFITVSDALSATGIPQNLSQNQPNVELTPCYANANGTTDLKPVKFSFKYIKYGKFLYTVGIKNEGPRCVKKLQCKITYYLNGVDNVYKEFSFLPRTNGWVLEAGETRYMQMTFNRKDLPLTAFTISNDSETQESFFTLDGLKLVVDFTMEVVETDETNNVYRTVLNWVED